MNRFVYILLFSAVLANASPDFVLEVCRHGARSVESSKYDNTWANIGYGELTSVGMRQHYILGKILKETYPDLLLPYSPSTIRVFASALNRTLMSATSQLYGIYESSGPSLPEGLDSSIAVPPFDTSDIEGVQENLNYTSAFYGSFQPIPIHSAPANFDYLLQPYLNCPALESLYTEHTNDTNVQEIFSELSDTADYFESLGYTISSINNLKGLGDAAISAYYYGKPLPGNITVDSQLYEDLKFAYEWYEVYATFAETTQRQVFSGPLLSEVLSYMQAFQAGTTSYQFVLWSGHETTLFAILSALNVTTPECLVANWRSQRANETIPYPNCIYPAFADNIIFEYYNTSDPYVIVKYGGNDLILCGDSNTCSLNDFTNLVQNVTNGTTLQAYYNICNVSQDTQITVFESFKHERGYPKEIIYVLSGVIAVLMSIIGFLLIRNNKANNNSDRDLYIAQRA